MPVLVKRIATILAVSAPIAVAFFLLKPEHTNPDDSLAGSQSCRECHATFYERWETSRHGRSVQHYSPEFARLHFSSSETTLRSGSLVIEPVKGLVTVENDVKQYPIRYVVGGKNVFYLLAKIDRGRYRRYPSRSTFVNANGSIYLKAEFVMLLTRHEMHRSTGKTAPSHSTVRVIDAT